ncbi:hypothetical protein AMK59_902 [Oryctes borbonicus]|uniref:NADP-dependent oxidoreductase domain-containing protein n=1 Tax=Oryctes borbonicus TaxID=1629725 RepID=A0A0T6BGB7_9SCAR|nr:hypothetical protein AMK59_902 [Oryctes borbonicus]
MACDIFLTLQPGDVKMPALGYGTWQSVNEPFEKALETALEVGYRHIDTAARYMNEEIIGRVLKRWFDSGKLKREDIFITTKLSPMAMDPQKVEDCIKESLQKLQLDYVDLYLIHFPLSIIVSGSDSYGDPNFDFLDVWQKMEEQVDAGRTKTIGVSNFSVKKVDRLLKNCRIKPANNQVEMHLYLQQKELVDFCMKNGVTVVAYAPLASRGYNKFLGTIGKPPRDLPDMFEDPVVVAIANKYLKKPSQVALRFLLQVGVAPIPKSVTPERVKENFGVFDFVLDDDDMTKLRSIDKGNEGRVCDFRAAGRLYEHPDFEL